MLEDVARGARVHDDRVHRHGARHTLMYKTVKRLNYVLFGADIKIIRLNSSDLSHPKPTWWEESYKVGFESGASDLQLLEDDVPLGK